MVDFEHHPNCGGVMPCPCAELRALRARVAEMERDARLGAAMREAIDATHAPIEETDKSRLVYVTIEYDEWRCRLMLRTREWMRMYPYVAAQALCDVLMKAMASVLSQEDTDDGDA